MIARRPRRRRRLAAFLAARAFALLWAAPWTVTGLALAAALLALGGRARWIDGALEVAPRRPPRRAWPFAAITLGHVVLGVDPVALARVRGHERVHVRQYERYGPFLVPLYLLASAWVWVRGGHPYRDNPFEREARQGAAGC
ncbi:MAG TPA: signal peptide prediction [Burkholderiaceae bacterium]|nr:signal peptide prediction [Burkholderiaceae bacterium]